MKITAYEVREDETEIMKKLADKLGIDELVTTAEPLTLDTAHLAKGAAVIKNLSGFGCKILAHSRHEDEQIGALALDVFENENGIYHHDRKTDIIKNKDMAYLRQFPNVIMTQHMAFYTEQAIISMVHCGLESLVAFAENKEYRCQLQ